MFNSSVEVLRRVKISSNSRGKLSYWAETVNRTILYTRVMSKSQSRAPGPLSWSNSKVGTVHAIPRGKS